MQSLTPLAKHSDRQYAADTVYQSWSGLRDGGVVTTIRCSWAPYVNQIDEAAFICDHRESLRERTGGALLDGQFRQGPKGARSSPNRPP